MKKRRRLNKVGKLALSGLILIMILFAFSLFPKSDDKFEEHVLKNEKYYDLKIDYPILHKQKIDEKIKKYIEKEKANFFEAVEAMKERKEDNKYDFIVQYQMHQEQEIYHIHITRYAYTGGNHYMRDDQTYHYDSKNQKFLTINDYLKESNDLEKLSTLSYYYIMKYGEDHQIQFDEEMVKDGLEAKKENFNHFYFDNSGLELLFPPYQVAPWCDGEIKIVIPYKEVNALLKKQYQQDTKDVLKEIIVPQKRNLDQFSGKKLIAFTFDDGPSTTTTNLLLDGLDKYQARVTFFVLGSRVSQNQDVLKRAYQEGNQIGSHTYHHRNLLRLSDYERMQEIRNTNEEIEKIIGVKPTLLRPPFGNINTDVKKLAGMHIIEWSIDPLDWKYHDKNKVADEIVKNAHDGAIVLVHDIYKSSVEGALLAMERLQKEGYAFVTIEEMTKLKNVTLDETTSYFHF